MYLTDPDRYDVDERVVWPLPFPEVGAKLERHAEHFLDLAASKNDLEERFVIIGAAVQLMAAIQTLVEAALNLDAAAKRGLAFKDLPSEASFLNGDIDIDELPAPYAERVTRIGRPATLQSIRDLKLTLSWNRTNKLRAIFDPAATIITTNALLQEAIQETDIPVRFLHTWRLFEQGKRHGTKYHVDIEQLAREVATRMSNVAGLHPNYVDRLRSLLQREARFALGQAAEALVRLSAASGLPLHVWSGTAGNLGSRLIGLEAIRRGGSARRFAHGLNSGIWYRKQKPFRFVELAASSEFTVPTAAFADYVSETGVVASMPAPFGVKISHGRGDSHLRKIIPAAFDREEGRLRRRVLYAPTESNKFRQFISPQLPYAVYREWQHRLARMLEPMPVDVVCCQHPADRSSSVKHPFAGFAEMTRRRFDDEVNDADIVLFDYFKSSTTAVALCTDRPIVYLDLECLEFEPKGLAELSRRCRILSARYDERGRPLIDTSELEDALTAPLEVPDSTYFISLYAGS